FTPHHRLAVRSCQSLGSGFCGIVVSINPYRLPRALGLLLNKRRHLAAEIRTLGGKVVVYELLIESGVALHQGLQFVTHYAAGEGPPGVTLLPISRMPTASSSV